MLLKPVLNFSLFESDDLDASPSRFTSQNATDGNSSWVLATVTSGLLAKYDQRRPEHFAKSGNPKSSNISSRKSLSARIQELLRHFEHGIAESARPYIHRQDAAWVFRPHERQVIGIPNFVAH